MVLTTNETHLLLRECIAEIANIDPSRYGVIEGESEGARQFRYDWRNKLVMDAVFYARRLGYKAGFVVHQPISQLLPDAMSVLMNGEESTAPIWDPRWGVCAIIHLPEGQVSWHIDSEGLEWDGHTDATKWDRVRAYLVAQTPFERGKQ